MLVTGRLTQDVFAIGVLLWELYHSKGAWTGMNQVPSKPCTLSPKPIRQLMH